MSEESPLVHAFHDAVPSAAEILALLQKGANVNTPRRKDNKAPLHFAVEQAASLEVVACLLEHGADPLATTRFGKKTPLHLAIANGASAGVVSLLIKNGSNIHAASGGDKKTALHYAADKRATADVVVQLLGAASATTRLLWLLGAYHTTTEQKLPEAEAVQALIKEGAEVNAATSGFFRTTPLLCALVASAPPSLVSLLLEQGADVNVVNWDGRTPLHVAVDKTVVSREVVAMLLEKRADINAKNWAGMTALHFEVRNKANLDVVAMLIENAVDVNSRTIKTLKAPLHFATDNEACPEVLALLLASGADRDATDLHGVRPTIALLDPKVALGAWLRVTSFDQRDRSGLCSKTNSVWHVVKHHVLSEPVLDGLRAAHCSHGQGWEVALAHIFADGQNVAEAVHTLRQFEMFGNAPALNRRLCSMLRSHAVACVQTLLQHSAAGAWEVVRDVRSCTACEVLVFRALLCTCNGDVPELLRRLGADTLPDAAKVYEYSKTTPALDKVQRIVSHLPDLVAAAYLQHLLREGHDITRPGDPGGDMLGCGRTDSVAHTAAICDKPLCLSLLLLHGAALLCVGGAWMDCHQVSQRRVPGADSGLAALPTTASPVANENEKSISAGPAFTPPKPIASISSTGDDNKAGDGGGDDGGGDKGGGDVDGDGDGDNEVDDGGGGADDGGGDDGDGDGDNEVDDGGGGADDGDSDGDNEGDNEGGGGHQHAQSGSSAEANNVFQPVEYDIRTAILNLIRAGADPEVLLFAAAEANHYGVAHALLEGSYWLRACVVFVRANSICDLTLAFGRRLFDVSPDHIRLLPQSATPCENSSFDITMADGSASKGVGAIVTRNAPLSFAVGQCVEVQVRVTGKVPIGDAGRTAKQVGQKSVNPTIRDFFQRLSSFCGRYNLAPRFDFKSVSSVLHRAEDFDGNQVVIKFMRNQTHQATEIKGREKLDNNTHVVGIVEHSGSPELTEAQFRAGAEALGYRGYHYGVVMPALDRNLAVVSLQEAPDALTVADIMRQVASCVQVLHVAAKRVHGDIKPLNIMRDFNGRWKLIDLDASALIDQESAGAKLSEAYCAPELARYAFIDRETEPTAGGPVAHPSLDVWSLGVVLYESLTGRQLFAGNARTDKILTSTSRMELCMWLRPSAEVLAYVEHASGRHLVEWCLQGNPSDRPTIEKFIAHPFLQQPNRAGGGGDGPSLELSLPPRTHAMVSHYQVEGAGEASRIARALEAVGATAWVDMTASDLTEAGMKAGVENAEVFLLMLTSNVLTRPFCLKEIGWALEANKPIIALVEVDDRFFPWDFDQWKANHVWDKTRRCYRPCTDSEGSYASMEGHPLHRRVRDEVQEMAEASMLIPLRRRNFEVEAMVAEIVRRAGHSGCRWRLPPPVSKAVSMRNGILVSAIFNPANASDIVSELRSGVESRATQWTDNPLTATHLIVVLTGNTVTKGSDTAASISALMKSRHRPFVFVFATSHGWAFGSEEHMGADEAIQNALRAHEAMSYRPRMPSQLRYEYEAMMDEILARLLKRVSNK